MTIGIQGATMAPALSNEAAGVMVKLHQIPIQICCAKLSNPIIFTTFSSPLKVSSCLGSFDLGKVVKSEQAGIIREMC